MRQALALPVLAGARLVAGAPALDRPVRWAHVSDLYDVAAVLLGGELLLTTGAQLALADAQQRVYVRSLTDRGVAAVVVECVRQFAGGLPAALVDEAEAQGLALAEVHHTIRFVEVTQAIHGQILGEQLVRLRRAEEAGQAFTRVVLEERGITGVLRALGQMLGRNPVAWLPVGGGTLVHPAGSSLPGPLDQALRALPPGRRSAAVGQITQVSLGAGTERVLRQPVWLGGRPAGSLVCLERRTALDPTDLPILDRASAAIAYELLLQRGAGVALAAAHRDVIARLLAAGAETSPGLRQRAAALADFHDHDAMTVVVCRVPDPGSQLQQRLRAAGLTRIAVADGDPLRAIVADETPSRLLHRLQRALAEGPLAAAVGAGGITETVGGLRGAWLQARFVAALRADEPQLSACFDRLGAHRLLYGLRHAEALRLFVAATLGDLLATPGGGPRSRGDGEPLLETLTVLLASNGNKVEAARRLGVRRQSLYLRLLRIEQRLGRPLSDATAPADLSLALIGLAVRRAAAAEEVD